MSDQADFVIDRGELIQYVGPGGEVHVPAGVTSVASCAFRNRKDLLERVVFPETLRELHAHVFEDCGRLREAALPRSLRFIGHDAFAYCRNLAKVILPRELTAVERRLFYGCRSLSEVWLPSELDRIEDGAFCGCAALRGIVFPKKLARIGSPRLENSAGSGAFEGSGLVDISIPNSVRIIGAGAFRDCYMLESVRMGAGVTQIGARAFAECRQLRRMIMPRTVSHIGTAAFSGCPDPKGATEPADTDERDGCVIVNGVMKSYVWTSSHVRIPDDVVQIEDGAFSTLLSDIKRNPRPLTISIPAGLQRWNCPFPLNDSKCVIRPPKNFLRRATPAPMPLTRNLIKSGALRVGLEDAVFLFCFQHPELARIGEVILEKSLLHALPTLFSELRKKRTLRAMLRTAELLSRHARQIPQSALRSFYALFAKAGAFLPASMAGRLAFPEPPETFAERISADVYEAAYVDAVFSDADISPDNALFGRVRYAETKDHASAHLVKCVLLPYLLQTRNLSDAQDVLPELRISAETWELERCLRREDLENLAAEIFPLRQLKDHPRWLAPFCRFAGEIDISRFNRLIRTDFNWIQPLASRALALSDTREAMCCCADHTLARSDSLLSYYCAQRGIDVPEADGDFRLHTDSDARKTWNIKGKTVSLQLCDDLRFRWVTEGILADTAVRLGFSDADAKVLDEEKAIKQSRAEELIAKDTRKLESAFLRGTSIQADAFRHSYAEDALMRRLINGIVWSQGRETFAGTPRGFVRSDGSPYVLSEQNVRMAHPLEMTAGETESWKAFLTREGVAPPIGQLSEELQDPETPLDRYNGCVITEEDCNVFCRECRTTRDHPFRLRTPNDSFAITCRPESGNGALLRLGSFYVDRFDRLANRALNVLERVSIEGRVAKDDVSVLRLIDRLGLGPEKIRRLLNVAIGANASTVVAGLLEQSRSLPRAEDTFTLD